MNKINKVQLFLVVFFMFLMIFPMISNALPDPGCDPGDPACPIDGGLSILIAAGVGLGARKALRKK